MRSPREPVPDLLKRFVPTPFKRVTSGLTIESNDVSLLDAFDAVQAEPFGYKIRIVREGAFPPIHSTTVACTDATCLLVSSDAVIVVDREHKVAFVFVASGVLPESLAQELLPAALRHPHLAGR